MDTPAFRSLLRAQDNEAEITEAFPAWLTEPQNHLPVMRSIVAEAAAQPDNLKDASARQELRLALLYLALAGDQETKDDFLTILRHPETATVFPQNDWLFNEMPKVLSRLLRPDQLPLLGEMILERDLSDMVREQLLMCILFRWLSKTNSSQEISNVLRLLLEKNLGGLKNPQLAMAMIVNAIAVDGKNLQGQVMRFYRQGGPELSLLLPEKTLQIFFDLGQDKLKKMLLQNYDSSFTDPKVELKKLFHPPSKEEQEAQLPSQSKPIVRETAKINRNAPCPCGSGKKYKKCCGQ